MIRLCEMFNCIQGEGLEIGQPTFLLRLSGCNLHCDFCDSKYHTSGKEISVESLVSKIEMDSKGDHLTISGGEPTLQERELRRMFKLLPPSYTKSLETNGTRLTNLKYDVIAVSPKKQQIVLSILKKYVEKDNTFFKFVYENKTDKWWEEVIKKCGIPTSKVFIMPEGMTRQEQLKKMPEVIEYCIENNYNFCPRLQVLAYNKRRGV